MVWLNTLRNADISVNLWTQKNFQSAEHVWKFLSEELSPAQLIDVFVPLVGILNHQLLVRLACSLGLINAIASSLKWCTPVFRPYWWLREIKQPLFNFTNELRQHRLTCETSGGFPSSHVMAFTTFSYLVIVFSFAHLTKKLQLDARYLNLICKFVTAVVSLSMWLSRVYFGTQFLHICIISSVAAVALLQFFDRHSRVCYILSRGESVFIVTAFGLLPVLIYCLMLRAEVDPHWSVRMAFKWCSDPSYMRHESSSIFVLCRDFGYLMGVALAKPMYKRYKGAAALVKRVFVISLLQLLNYHIRQATPKQYGRFIFVAYEFARNLAHSSSLLVILSKIN